MLVFTTISLFYSWSLSCHFMLLFIVMYSNSGYNFVIIYIFPTFGWGFGTGRQNSFYSLSIRCGLVCGHKYIQVLPEPTNADALLAMMWSKAMTTTKMKRVRVHKAPVWSMTKSMIWLVGVNRSIEPAAAAAVAKNQFNFCRNLLHKELLASCLWLIHTPIIFITSSRHQHPPAITSSHHKRVASDSNDK